jgi:hypothetical protein
MKTVACTVRCSAGGLAAGDRTGDKIAGATRSEFGIFRDARVTGTAGTIRAS